MKYSETSTEEIAQLAAEFPSRLVVMLYDDMLENLDVIVGAIEAEDIEARYVASERIAEVLYQLCIALDLRNGGVIAANLASLYKHGIQQMTEINFTNDASIAVSLKNILEPLRVSWAELDERIQSDVNEAEAMILDPAFADAFAKYHGHPVGAGAR
ncbi:MAG: flagellar protein FliS [Paracoccaceae bacterium]|jgi:flagellar protein FliS